MKITRRTISLLCIMLALSAGISLFVRDTVGAQSSRADSEQNTSEAVIEKYFKDSLLRARALAGKEKFNSALEIVSAVIALNPASDIVSKAKDLFNAIENARILAEVLEAEIEADSNIYETGNTVKITMRLYNRSLGLVIIPLKIEEKKTIFGTQKKPVPNLIRIKHTALDFGIGGVSQSVWQTSAEFNEEIRLEPGAFWEKQIDLKLNPDKPGKGDVRRLSIRFKLFPVVFEQDGERRVWHQYRTLRKTINVVPTGASQYQRDPFNSALAALAGGNGLALLYSIGAVDNRERAILVPIIISHLEKTPTNSPQERYLLVALQHITSMYGRLTKNMWLNWWQADGEDFVLRLYPEMRRMVFSVEIAPDGAISHNGKILTAEQVKDQAKKFIYKGGQEFVIRCSGAAKFSHVANLMNMMNAAGAGNVRIFAADNNDGSKTDE